MGAICFKACYDDLQNDNNPEMLSFPTTQEKPLEYKHRKSPLDSFLPTMSRAVYQTTPLHPQVRSQSSRQGSAPRGAGRVDEDLASVREESFGSKASSGN